MAKKKASQPTKKMKVAPAPEPKVEKPKPAPTLPEPVLAPKLAPKTSPAPPPARDPALPPLPPPTPPPPLNPNRLPFQWKKERPKSRPCHRCDKETKLTTPIQGGMDNYEPKDDEGLYMEWWDDLIVTVVCAPCWRTGFGKSW